MLLPLDMDRLIKMRYPILAVFAFANKD